ncbi:MAG: hypothetical protein KDB00_29050 [Planctomycetales bacterium]|nr:hypothetical protein [Planctomycetales bacterium]
MADQRLAVLNKVDRNALESLLMDFERGWNREAFSQVCERLGTDARDEYRRLAMEELAKVDLHRQWSDGATPLLEDYIRRFPSLGPVEKVSVDLVLAEYEARRAVDPGVDLAEYQSRYPDQFDDLKRLAEQLIDSKPSDAPKPASQDAAAQA